MKLKKKSDGKRKFEYKPLSKKTIEDRKNQAGDRDSYVQSGVQLFTPDKGANSVRILPPTWDDAEGYGFPVSVHYGIGPDSSAYLCLKAMKGEKCPICDERAKADKEGDEDYARELKASKRIAVYVIDRDNEGDGPKLWLMPSSLEKDMAALAVNKKTQEVLQFPDPEEGYDFSFEKQGKDLKTKYLAPEFDRKSSPLSEDEDTAEEWLNHIQENPIPDVLVYHDADHIAEVFGAGAAEEEEDDKKKDKKKKDADEEDDDDDKKKDKKKKDDDDELPSFAEVHEMDEEELTAFAEEKDVDLSDQEFDDLEEAADYICEELGIEEDDKKKDKKKKDADEEEDDDDKKKDKKKGGKKDLPSYKEVMDMDEEELTELAQENEVDMDHEFDDLEEAAKHVCEELGIEEDAEEEDKKKGKLSGLKSKLRKKD